MSVWLTIPSARPASEIAERLGKWRAMGYKIALWRNGPHATPDGADIKDLVDWSMYTPDYRGWAFSCNFVMKMMFGANDDCDWCVCGGDDTEPDCTKWADVIVNQLSAYFLDLHGKLNPRLLMDGAFIRRFETFGVMQATGDRWGENEPWARAQFPDAPAYIDRICGSPWIGREFARRMNQGKGPFWREYFHMFADEELQCVAQRMGVLWQRRDLTHHHEHPRRDGAARTPDFAAEIYSSGHWQASKSLFDSRKKAGFPGSECIA
jgi:hypothetical protein